MKMIKINSLQFGTIIFFFIFASLIGISVNNTAFYASRDAVISVILSYVIGFIPIIIFLYLFKQDKNIIELINYTFGKRFGLVINIILVIPIIVISGVVISTISNFLVSQFLADTPIYVIYLCMFVVIIYAVYSGIEAISRTALVLSSLVTLYFIISVLGISSNIKIDNFLPLFEHGIVPDIKASIFFVLTDIIPIFIMLCISKKNIRDKENVNKSIIISYSIGMFVSLASMIMTIGSLGIYLTNIYEYPEYMMLKKISFFNFLNRIENLISIHWLFLSLLIVTISVYYVNRLIKIKKKKNSIVVSFLTLIVIYAFCIVTFKNNTMLVSFTKYIYPYVNLGYFVILLVISVIYYFKSRKVKV